MITVYGSHGELLVGTIGYAGHVLSCDNMEYANIHRFDLEEWLRHYGEPLPSRIDILDLGYWYWHREKLLHEMPDPQHRTMIALGEYCMVLGATEEAEQIAREEGELAEDEAAIDPLDPLAQSRRNSIRKYGAD